jgi:hypothetical protein
VQKELKTFYDGSRKANLDVEIAVDMLSLAGRYDTRCWFPAMRTLSMPSTRWLTKAVACEIAGFRSNTAPKLIDVADCSQSTLVRLRTKLRKRLCAEIR